MVECPYLTQNWVKTSQHFFLSNSWTLLQHALHAYCLTVYFKATLYLKGCALS